MKICVLGPHISRLRSPLDPHLTQNWVPIWSLILIFFGPHCLLYYVNFLDKWRSSFFFSNYLDTSGSLALGLAAGCCSSAQVLQCWPTERESEGLAKILCHLSTLYSTFHHAKKYAGLELLSFPRGSSSHGETGQKSGEPEHNGRMAEGTWPGLLLIRKCLLPQLFICDIKKVYLFTLKE